MNDNDYTKAITAVCLKGELEAPRRLLDYCLCVVKHFDDPTSELKRDTQTSGKQVQIEVIIIVFQIRIKYLINGHFLYTKPKELIDRSI